MQTYLPLPDYNQSAEVLDDRRLNKQRSDVLQILKGCAEPKEEKEHPAITMWRGNELALINYGLAICLEWTSRGNSDQSLAKIMSYKATFEESSSAEKPEWFGNEEFHKSHRSALVRLMPTHYRQYWPEEDDDFGLVWPRSPHKGRKSAEQREKDRAYKAALKARESRDSWHRKYLDACEAAGLNPDTFEPLDGSTVEVVEIGSPDPDLLDL